MFLRVDTSVTSVAVPKVVASVNLLGGNFEYMKNQSI